MSDEDLNDTYLSQQEQYRTQVIWMPQDEEEQWRKHSSMIIACLGMGLIGWGTFYAISHVIGGFFRKQRAALSEKDQPLFHIYFVSVMHAAISVTMGISWIATEWSSAPEGRVFGFNYAYFIHATIEFSFQVFDLGLVILNSSSYNVRYLVTIIVHHLVFAFSFLLSQAFPAVLFYKLCAMFQLTEVTSVFLHLNWFLMRMKGHPFWVITTAMVLQFFFVVRVLIACFATYFAWSCGIRNELWSLEPPIANSQFLRMVVVATLGAGPLVVTFINFEWFQRVVARVQGIIQGYQSRQR